MVNSITAIDAAIASGVLPIARADTQPANCTSTKPATCASTQPRRTPPPRAVVALDTHLHTLQDGVAELHRERNRLAALPTHPAPFDPAHCARVGLLEAECVRLRRRVRELEQTRQIGLDGPDVHPDQQRRAEDMAEEDPDVTIRAAAPLAADAPPRALAAAVLPPAPPPPLLPPIDLRPAPTPRQSDPLHSPAPPHRPPSAHLPRPSALGAANAQEQRLAQLAAELVRAQDGVAERERAMEELRAEIARLRGG